jgi:hypothetical protein
MKKRIPKKVVLLFIVIAAVIFGFSPMMTKTIVWSIAVKWHIKNGYTYTFHGMRLHLPIAWYVMESKGNREVKLTRVPRTEHDSYPVVSIRVHEMCKDTLLKLAAKTKLGSDSVEYGNFDSLIVSGALAYRLSYRLIDEKHNGMQIEIWSIPSIKIAILASNISEANQKDIDSIIRNISLKKNV